MLARVRRQPSVTPALRGLLEDLAHYARLRLERSSAAVDKDDAERHLTDVQSRSASARVHRFPLVGTDLVFDARGNGLNRRQYRICHALKLDVAGFARMHHDAKLPDLGKRRDRVQAGA